MINRLYAPVAGGVPMLIPLYGATVPAGFPSPAEDYLEGRLDLNALLIRDAAATFMVRVCGDSMTGAGIGSGDVLVVDRGMTPWHGCIVLAIVDGEFTVKRLHTCDDRVVLMPENAAYAPIALHEGQELQIWGVVTGCVKSFL